MAQKINKKRDSMNFLKDEVVSPPNEETPTPT
jgi:hypothetical protein